MPGTYVSGIAISIIIASNVFVEGSRVNEPKTGQQQGTGGVVAKAQTATPRRLYDSLLSPFKLLHSLANLHDLQGPEGST